MVTILSENHVNKKKDGVLGMIPSQADSGLRSDNRELLTLNGTTRENTGTAVLLISSYCSFKF